MPQICRIYVLECVCVCVCPCCGRIILNYVCLLFLSPSSKNFIYKAIHSSPSTRWVLPHYITLHGTVTKTLWGSWLHTLRIQLSTWLITRRGRQHSTKRRSWSEEAFAICWLLPAPIYSFKIMQAKPQKFSHSTQMTMNWQLISKVSIKTNFLSAVRLAYVWEDFFIFRTSGWVELMKMKEGGRSAERVKIWIKVHPGDERLKVISTPFIIYCPLLPPLYHFGEWYGKMQGLEYFFEALIFFF